MGVARVYRAGSPYNGVELAQLDFEQTADTLYLAHIDHAPGKLVRSGHVQWQFLPVGFGPMISPPGSCSAHASTPNMDGDNDGKNYFPQPARYCITAINDDTGQESRASPPAIATNDLTLKRNYNSISWAGVTGATRYHVYKAENSQFFGYIGTTESLSFRDDNIGPALDQAPPALWDPFAAAGDYPSTVTLFEQRSVWARTGNAPNAVFASRSGQLENMDRSRPLREDDSLSFTIIAGRVNSVNQLVSTTGLLALTSDSVFTIDGDGQGGILTGNSPPATRRQIGRGSTRLPPLVVDNVVFYAPSTGSAVRTINYSFEIDGLRSSDVSIFSPHFFEGMEITSWCYAQEPRSLIWAARSDGALLCFTWEQEQNVWGWTLCETDGHVLNLCSITEAGEDRVYLIVERMVDGQPRRFVERMASQHWDDVRDCCFLDCAVSARFDVPQSRFAGLWHLEGRNDVAALVDGVAVRGLSVTGGELQLPAHLPAGRVVRFGLAYRAEVELLPLRMAMDGIGTNIGRRQQSGDIVLTLRDSRAVLAGIDGDHLFPLKSRTQEAWGTPDALMTGDYVVTSAGKAGDAITCLIRQNDPLPFTLLGAARDVIVQG